MTEARLVPELQVEDLRHCMPLAPVPQAENSVVAADEIPLGALRHGAAARLFGSGPRRHREPGLTPGAGVYVSAPVCKKRNC
jgi:hypothetical protein